MSEAALKKRLKKARKDMVGKIYEYYPTAVAFNKNLPVGEKVVVATLPQGDLLMMEVVKADACKINYGGTSIPDNAERYTIFMRDLTII